MDEKGNDDFLDMENEETFFEHTSKTTEDDEFDSIISSLEELLFNEEFMDEQSSFFEKNCEVFEDQAENKLEYTEIFNQYKITTENVIERSLRSRISGFTMRKFEKLLSTRSDQLSGEVFDLLLSLADFSEFKETMISYKNKGKGQLDLSICGYHLK